MYGGLPITVVPCAALSRNRDVPKSVTLSSPVDDTRMLPGRRSRCRMPAAWAWSTALQIWQVKSSATDSSSGPSRLIRSSSVSPSTYSMTMKNTSSCFSAVITVTMFGWLIDASSRGSLSRSPKSTPCLCGTLIATFLSIQVSSAR